MTVLFWLEISCAAVFVGCLLCMLLLSCLLRCEKRKSVHIPTAEMKTRFAVIVPARNESAVIEENLRALQNAEYPTELHKTFVIVESMDDPTVEICRKYPNTEIYLRKNYDRPGKGPALDECLKSMFQSEEHFDAVMLLDADNVIAPNFFARLNDAYVAGYDAACGKRNNSDWNSSAKILIKLMLFTIILIVINLRGLILFYVELFYLLKNGKTKFDGCLEYYP